MNKYLKIANNRLNKRFVKLNTSYFHLTESVGKIRNIERDNLSKALMNLTRQLSKLITIDDIVDYIKLGKPIITYDKLNGILKTESKKTAIVVFDTETTGLIGKSTEKNFRNQIYEIAAVTYDYSLNEVQENDRVDFFHAKVQDEKLNASNSVKSLTAKLKSGLNSELDMKMLDDAYKAATVINQHQPDMPIFKSKISDKYIPFAYDLVKMLKIKSLREMTKADKEKFVDLWTSKEYDVALYNSEAAMLTAFFNYIEKQEKKFEKIYILAHNLKFDKNIVVGSLEDSVKYWQKRNDNPKMLSQSQELLTKANRLFDTMNTSDTLNGFKSLFNEKKYIDKIDLLVKELKIYTKKIPKGEKGYVSKLLVLLTKIPKTKDPNFRTTSLGKVAPAGINKDWHTAVNDVFVTVATTKMYFTMPMIISILIKISETYEKTKTIIYLPEIKIPSILIRFAIKTKFHHAYDKVKKQIEASGVKVPFWAENDELKETKKTSPEKVYKFKNPDFPDKTDIEGTAKESTAKGVKLLEKLATQKDFMGIVPELEKAKAENKMPEAKKALENMGVNVSVKELDNIAKSGFSSDVELLQNNKKLYDELLSKKDYILAEYREAQKKKQGAQYVSNRINKKFNMTTTKENIVSILKAIGAKK